MYRSDIIEYTNRNKMEETTGKVFARLNHMKSILCKTIKKTPQFCGGISNHYGSPTSYYSITNDDIDKFSEPIDTSLTNITSDDTISSISGDSGVSTLSDYSHSSLISVSSLSITIKPSSTHLRCDPSIINYISHDLLTTHHSEYFLNEIDDHHISESPIAESSRRTFHDNDQTIIGSDEEDEQTGPLTSTLIDRWYTVTKSYSATFREDLSVRKNELIQVLRCTHPHWIWVRNEESNEGFIPTDCLMTSK